MQRQSAIVPGVILAAAGIAVVVHGQATTRPGEPTQARVWIENRAAGEAIPVAVQSVPSPLRVQLDPATVVLTSASRQTWEYRSIPLASGADPARGLAAVGAEGWEAVGVLQSGAAGTTVLLKRPR